MCRGNVGFTNQTMNGVAEPVEDVNEVRTKMPRSQKIYSVNKGKVVITKYDGTEEKKNIYKINLPDGDYLIRKLYPIEAERLQTLPDNYTDCVSDTQRYKGIGNGWTVDVIAHILSGLKNIPEARTEARQTSIYDLFDDNGNYIYRGE